MPALAHIAVVVPVGPGEQAWREVIPALEPFGDAVLACVAGDTVAAGGAVRTIAGAPGRARQLNAGAAATRLPWLLFLHADSRLDDAAVAAIRAAPDQDFIGYCDLSFYDGPPLMAVNAAGAWLRSRLFGLPFGDQGMLLRRGLFERLGGFDEQIDRGEDHALIWRARRAGIRLRPLGARLGTSARRYAEGGWWTITRRHLCATVSQARRWSRPQR